MGQLVLGIAGAVAGSFVGQPGLGFAIGYGIGGAMFPPKGQTVRNQPQPLIDLKVTGTDYGQPIPYVRGAAGIAGQVWWNSDRRPITTVTTSGGGGSKGGGGGQPVVETTIVTYDIDLLIGLTDNVIVGIARIWDNGKLVYTADGGASVGSIVASAAAELWDRMTVYTGAADQLPDPDYEAAVGSANAPAYRGRGSVFVKGLKLGQGGQVRNLTFEVVADGAVVTASQLLVFDAAPGSQWGVAPMLTSGGIAWWTTSALDQQQAVNMTGGAIVSTVASVSPDQVIPLMTLPDGSLFCKHYGGGASNTSWWIFYLDGTKARLEGNLSEPFPQTLPNDGNIDDAGRLWLTGSAYGYVVRINSYDAGAGTLDSTDISPPAVSGYSTIQLALNAGAVSGRMYLRSTTSAGLGGWGYFNTATDVFTALHTLTGSSTTQMIVDPAGFVYTAGDLSGGATNQLLKFDADGNLLASIPVSGMTQINYFALAGGNLWANIFKGGASWLEKINIASWTVESEFNVSASSPSTLSMLPVRTVSGMPVLYNQAAGAFALYIYLDEPVITAAPPTVASVVSALCQRAGLSAGQIDVTALSSITRKVRSLALSQIAPPRQWLELLASTYFFEAVTSDKIYFRPRGGSAVSAIPYLDLGAAMSGDEQPEPLALRQVNDLEIPAQIALTYINVSDDYQSDTQNSDRLVSSAAGTVSAVSMAIGMTPSEAKGVADTMLFDQAASIVSTPLALLGDYCRLEPTDPVTVTGADGSIFRLRLVKKTDSYPLLTFDAVLDDVSVLASQGITSADYSPGTVVAPAVDTSMELLDIPILQDVDNDAGFYVAAKGDAAPWSGAGIFNSVDNVDYIRRASVMEAAVFGVCTTTLGAWTGPRVFDETNSVTVNVGAGALSSTTRDALLNSLAVNAMVIGLELIQFRTASLVSAGIYTLSGLLRGGRGTEWAMTGHAAAERCVLLTNAGLRRILLQNSELGLSRYYKAVTLGRALSTADAEQFTDNAIGLKPFSPFDLRAARDGSNNITFTWQRRTRLSARTIGALGISVPLGETSEAYEVEIYSNGTYASLLRTISATTPSAGYTAAQQVADGLTPGATVYAKVFQRSAAVGRGYPLEAAA